MTTFNILEIFCNTLRFLFNQAPKKAAYQERQQVCRIRERLSKQVELYLLEWEVNSAQFTNNYDVLMTYLHRQDVLFFDSRKFKTSSIPSNKRPTTKKNVQVAEVVERHQKNGVSSSLFFCSKPGHLIDAC